MLIVNLLTMIHTSLSKILGDKSSLSFDAQPDQRNIANMSDSLLKVLKDLFCQTKEHYIKSVLSEMMNDIKTIVCGPVTDEIAEVINYFLSNSVEFHDNFNTLEQSIED